MRASRRRRLCTRTRFSGHILADACRRRLKTAGHSAHQLTSARNVIGSMAYLFSDDKPAFIIIRMAGAARNSRLFPPLTAYAQYNKDGLMTLLMIFQVRHTPPALACRHFDMVLFLFASLIATAHDCYAAIGHYAGRYATWACIDTALIADLIRLSRLPDTT